MVMIVMRIFTNDINDCLWPATVNWPCGGNGRHIRLKSGLELFQCGFESLHGYCDQKLLNMGEWHGNDNDLCEDCSY